MTRAKSTYLAVVAVLSSPMALATPIELDFFGINVSVVGEFINAVQVDLADQEFAPLFTNAMTVQGTVSYDTSTPDVDSDPNIGTYTVGSLQVTIPELGILAQRAGNNLSEVQISAFNDVGDTNDQFFTSVEGFDTFVNNVGLPNPLSFSISLVGDTSMLADDSLPTGPFDWSFGNLSFNFEASDGTNRQVLTTFTPGPIPVAEPGTLALLGIGLAGMGLMRRRRKV